MELIKMQKSVVTEVITKLNNWYKCIKTEL